MDITKGLPVWEGVQIGVVNGPDKERVTIVIVGHAMIDIPNEVAMVLGKAIFAKANGWSLERTREFLDAHDWLTVYDQTGSSPKH